VTVLHSDSYYGPESYPNIAERLPDGTFLVIQGQVVTTGSATGLSGPMNTAGLMRWDQRFPTSSSFLGGCFSQSKLRFTLTPR
jgi:hypothetical protein